MLHDPDVQTLATDLKKWPPACCSTHRPATLISTHRVPIDGFRLKGLRTQTTPPPTLRNLLVPRSILTPHPISAEDTAKIPPSRDTSDGLLRTRMHHASFSCLHDDETVVVVSNHESCK